MKKNITLSLLLFLTTGAVYSGNELEPGPGYVRMYSGVSDLSARTSPVKRSPVLFKLQQGEDVYFTGNKGKKSYRMRVGSRWYKDVFYEVQNWEGKKGWVFGPGLKTAVPVQDRTYINMPIMDKSFIHKLLPEYKVEGLSTNDALYVPLKDFDICFPNIKVNRNQLYQYKDSYFYVLNYISGGDEEPPQHPFFVFQKKELSKLTIEYKVSATIFLSYDGLSGLWKSRDIPPYDTPWREVKEKGSLMYIFTESMAHYNLLTHVPPEAFRTAEKEKARVWTKKHKADGQGSRDQEAYERFMTYRSDIMNLQLRVSWKDSEGKSNTRSINFYYQHGK